MGFIAQRRQKVQLRDKDGNPLPTTEWREPGQAVPEADHWPNAAVYVKNGWLRYEGGSPPVGINRAKYIPPREATEADIARANAGLEASSAFGQQEAAAEAAKDAEIRKQLEEMTKKKLMEVAKELKLSIHKDSTKAEFIDAIIASHLAEGGQPLPAATDDQGSDGDGSGEAEDDGEESDDGDDLDDDGDEDLDDEEEDEDQDDEE